MIKISKDEMEYLSSKKFRFGSTLHRTYSNRGNNRYYLTTSPKAMDALKKYRSAKVVRTYEG